MSFADVMGNLSGLPRILAALGTGGVSELAVNAKQNLDQQTQDANNIANGSGIPAFAYKEQSPDQINQAKAAQLANLGTPAGSAMFQNYNITPETALSNEEKKALIKNYQSETALRTEELQKAQKEQEIAQNIRGFRQALFPTLVEPGQEPQGPANASGATLPTTPASITTDPQKLQQAATAALLAGDTATAEGLNKMQRDKNLNLQDTAKINYLNARAQAANPTPIVTPTIDANGLPVIGQDYAKTLPPLRAIAAQQLVQGKGIWPTGTAWKSPQGQQLIADAQQIDPNLDANTFKKRGQMQVAFSKGPQGQKIASVNNAIVTGANLHDVSQTLGGPMYLNSVRNKVLSGKSDPTLTTYNNFAKTFADETASVTAQGVNGSSDTDRQKRLANYTADQAPEARSAAIKAGMTEALIKADALADEWNKNTLFSEQKTGWDYLSPQAKLSYVKVMGAPPEEAGSQKPVAPSANAQEIAQPTSRPSPQAAAAELARRAALKGSK